VPNPQLRGGDIDMSRKVYVAHDNRTRTKINVEFRVTLLDIAHCVARASWRFQNNLSKTKFMSQIQSDLWEHGVSFVYFEGFEVEDIKKACALAEKHLPEMIDQDYMTQRSYYTRSSE
jgi:hypothetical protein